jgi:hypothetical protein
MLFTLLHRPTASFKRPAGMVDKKAHVKRQSRRLMCAWKSKAVVKEHVEGGDKARRVNHISRENSTHSTTNMLKALKT